MNKAERTWTAAITTYGCIVCRNQGRGFVPCAVHHLLSGGRRISHLETIGLCDPGHHQKAGSGEVSRHPFKNRFEARYGTERELLAQSRRDLGFNEKGLRNE